MEHIMTKDVNKLISKHGPRVSYNLYGDLDYKLINTPIYSNQTIVCLRSVVICSISHINNIEDELKSLDNICKKDDGKLDNWWHCVKCHKTITDGEYHKKYCNSKKEKHKHKLTKDYTKQFVKDRCCFRCGRKDHYILNCTYPNK